MVPGRGPQETVVKLWTGPPHLKAGPRLEGPFLGWLSLVAAGGRPQLPMGAATALPERPHNMAAGSSCPLV